MIIPFDRRAFVRTITAATACLTLPHRLFAAPKKSVLVFTKSSGFEHSVVRRQDGKLSIAETAVTELGAKHGFDVTCSKDGRIFDSKDFHAHQAVFFFTTGDLTEAGTDKNPPCPRPASKLCSPPSSKVSDSSAATRQRYFPHRARCERSLQPLHRSRRAIRSLPAHARRRIHHSRPRPAPANRHIIINDPSFPGLEGVHSPVAFNEEWYSLKDFATDIHVIGTVDTSMLKNECYQRRPYPVVWARMNGQRPRLLRGDGGSPGKLAKRFLSQSSRWRYPLVPGDAKADLSQKSSYCRSRLRGHSAQVPPAPVK